MISVQAAGSTRWAAIGAVLLGLSITPEALAADPVGQIKTLTGTASIQRSGDQVAAAPGVSVYANDTLKTGAESSLGVTFIDNATLSLGPDADLLIDKYVYDPADSNMAFLASLRNGTLALISGDIVHNAPDHAAIATPSATIGIRGTRFVVRVEGEQ